MPASSLASCAMRAARAAASAAARLRALISSMITTAPSGRPASSRSGAVETATGSRLPSLRCRSASIPVTASPRRVGSWMLREASIWSGGTCGP